MPGGMPQPHPKGTTILVLGILSIVCCGPLGIAAWLMGNTAQREVEANPGAYSNAGSIQAGRILGIIGVVLSVLGLLWVVFAGGLAVLSGANS
jgi:hypothetical protein